MRAETPSLRAASGTETAKIAETAKISLMLLLFPAHCPIENFDTSSGLFESAPVHVLPLDAP